MWWRVEAAGGNLLVLRSRLSPTKLRAHDPWSKWTCDERCSERALVRPAKCPAPESLQAGPMRFSPRWDTRPMGWRRRKAGGVSGREIPAASGRIGPPDSPCQEGKASSVTRGASGQMHSGHAANPEPAKPWGSQSWKSFRCPAGHCAVSKRLRCRFFAWLAGPPSSCAQPGSASVGPPARGWIGKAQWPRSNSRRAGRSMRLAPACK